MKVAFHTLGCKVNSYETQAIRESFENLGFEVTDFSGPADAYIINTCSVTAMAEHKSRQMVNRARKLCPDAVIAAIGCYAQRDPEEFKASGVDIIVGNNHKSEVATLVYERLMGKQAVTAHLTESGSCPEAGAAGSAEIGGCTGASPATSPENGTCPVDCAEDSAYRDSCTRVSCLTHCTDYENQEISDFGRNVRAYVKIQDGCNRFCSYCIIPYVRGRSRLRKQEDIINEVSTLAANGYREVVLTGIDISMYTDLAGLIEKIDMIPGIERIRLGSLEESVITEDFVRRISACSHICPQFHLSLQSGCEATLKRMNRHYTPQQYAGKVDMLRSAFGKCAVTTDIIVGFAGETDEEFSESLDFVRKTGFTQSHVFQYSVRKGTAAERLPGRVSEAVKAARSKQMIELTDGLQRDYLQGFVGKRTEILAEEVVSRPGGSLYVSGFTGEYVKVLLKAEGHRADDLINRLIAVVPEKIVELKGDIMLEAAFAGQMR